MKQEFAEKLIEQNRKNYNFLSEDFAKTRAYPWEEMKELLTYIKKGDVILDIGSGSGRTFKLLQGMDVTFTGIDISEKMVMHCKKEYGDHALKPTFACQNAVSLSFDDSIFDRVFAVAVLHHIPSYDLRLKAMQEFYRVLKKGGLVLMTNWNLWQPRYITKVLKNGVKSIFGMSRYDVGDVIVPWITKRAVLKRYYHAFTVSELERLAKEAGFMVERNYLFPQKGKSSYLNSRNICTVLKK
ncbi:class I SAM-dependent methyltransferase [Patescibacteria group bacterium]|nr:class I SAM-dependent methyltransferase [Patescibacteria group bacterium]